MLNKDTLNNLAQEIWKSAESLRGKFKAYEYQNIVLPMITIRRIECVLEAWRNEQRAIIEKRFPNDIPAQIQERLKKDEKRIRFWNSSDWTLKRLHEEAPQLLEDNFRVYLKAFSPNIESIIDHFNFRETLGKLKKSGRLVTIVEQYAGEDLSLQRLSNLEMGYVYEELLRRFSEQSGEEAGEHFTPREVIRLMVELLDIQFSQELQSVAIYDPACGTGGMLSVAKTHLLDQIKDEQKRQDAEKLITLYGEELQPHNYAICTAEMLLKDDRCSIHLGNSLIPFNPNRDDKGDQLNTPDDRFDYMLSNPPFGVTWSDYKTQAEKFNTTRYQAGMPRSNDGALLFLQTMLAKMKPVAQGGSKIAIVFNGSPLSNGDCGSGESEIRRWIIENDWLDTIVMLPDQLFYNTGIYTYIWLLTNHKPDSHQRQIKIIDARDQSEKEPKSFGNKRNRMTDAHRQWVLDTYQNHWQHADNAKIKLFKAQDFAYHKVSVVFWQTDEHEQPAYIREPYEKTLSPAVIKKEQAFYDSELVFYLQVSDGQQYKPLKLVLQPTDVFDSVFRLALKNLYAEELAEALQGLKAKDHAAGEKTFINNLSFWQVEYRHRHYVQDNEYIPHGEDIQAFLEREIGKPIIRWQDSPQLGYEILPNKYFYHYQAPKPTAELLQAVLGLGAASRGFIEKFGGLDNMLLYLDNCCFNRPYDEQSQARIYLETQAKLYVQEQILAGQHDLIWSYILQFENDQNPHIAHKHEIAKWKNLAKYLIGASDDIIANAKRYQTFGLRVKDALHCACAVKASADYFLTTDKQLIKQASSIAEINVINPLHFIEQEL